MTQNIQSTWQSRIKALGPGLLVASAAVGGSHLIASTQAGALYGWQLAIIIILANVLKYPFFRFSVDYTMQSGKSLIEGYAQKSKAYLWAFVILSVTSATISTGALALLTASILKMALPFEIAMPVLMVALMAVTVAIVLGGHFKVLDKITKVIMFALTLSTVAAVVVAMFKGSQMQADFIEASPWNLASLGFVVALMGWMPAPLEVTAANSMWILAKQKEGKTSLKDAIFDFDLGFWTSAVLAVIFLALGVLVQYGNGEEVKLQGGAYVGQLINMYAATIGEWSRLLVIFIAFACMFGTLLTVVDLYGRMLAESQRLILRNTYSRKVMAFWSLYSAITGLILVLAFKGALGEMLNFAMIAAFLSAPAYAWLNYSLVRQEREVKISSGLHILALLGLVYLTGFALLFLLHHFGLLA
ncbi:MAG: divalent metal cation transporter [Neisseria sp.]|nr:divalent metal cation transporter [Neisseria sp.]